MKTLTVLLFLLFPAYGIAQGTSTGEANLKFLFPARILSMGGAPIADPDNSSASFANPACLAAGKSFSVMFSQLQWIQDVQTQLLSTSLPLSLGTAALTISSTSVADIPIREIPGPALGSFSYRSTTFQLGYGFNLMPELSLGSSVKYLYDKMYIDEASGYAIDLGALYRTPLEGLSVACALTNMGQMSAFRSQRTDLPTNIDVGAYYSTSSGDFDLAGALAVGRETSTGPSNELRIGGEATYNKLLSARVGYQTGYDIRGLSAGLGIHYSIVQLDYAYIPFSQGFGDANIITIGINL
jgi:hypothetical protein